MLEIRCEMWHVEEVKGCHNVEFICAHSSLYIYLYLFALKSISLFNNHNKLCIVSASFNMYQQLDTLKDAQVSTLKYITLARRNTRYGYK